MRAQTLSPYEIRYGVPVNQGFVWASSSQAGTVPGLGRPALAPCGGLLQDSRPPFLQGRPSEGPIRPSEPQHPNEEPTHVQRP